MGQMWPCCPSSACCCGSVRWVGMQPNSLVPAWYYHTAAQPKTSSCLLSLLLAPVLKPWCRWKGQLPEAASPLPIRALMPSICRTISFLCRCGSHKLERALKSNGLVAQWNVKKSTKSVRGKSLSLRLLSQVFMVKKCWPEFKAMPSRLAV